MADNPLRSLPSVHDVLATAPLQMAANDHAQPTLTAAVRTELAELRHRLRQGEPLDGFADADAEAVAMRVIERLGREMRPRLRPVINATGVLLHTNLGRAPIALEAANAAAEAARGYLNLELDLDSGKRSSRQNVIREWVCRLTGAESAVAVNNNAAATVIALRALCQGKEVILSRGQLIEIGGSFRIPEIMAVSGATLREVGTTNITRVADYERAISPYTAALMLIHPSNYCVAGFTKSVPIEALVALGRKHGLKVIDDIGSGALINFDRFGFRGEPVASERIAAGADLVLFSGDKLLGGPQAGIIAGRKSEIERIERDPLMRAFRLDKMTLAALETTLRLYANEERALQEIPVLRLLATPSSELRRQAEALAILVRGLEEVASVAVVEDRAPIGGGSLPEQWRKAWVLVIRAHSVPDREVARRLRLGTPAVLGRISRRGLVLDPATLLPNQEADLVRVIGEASRAGT